MYRVGRTGSDLLHKEQCSPIALSPSLHQVFDFSPPSSHTYSRTWKALLQDIPTPSFMLPSLCHDWDLGTGQT